MAHEGHTITVEDLDNHPYFQYTVKCSCGFIVYAVDDKQVEEHKNFHLTQAKADEAKQKVKQQK